MAKQNYTAEQIIMKLREVEVLCVNGLPRGSPFSLSVPPIQIVNGRVVFFRKGREKISTLKPLTVWIFAVPFRRRKRGTG